MEATFSKKENTRKAKTKKAEKVTPGGILVIILLTLLALITLVPFIWMVSASFKTNNEVFTIPIQWIPKSWHPENYSVIWEKYVIFKYCDYDYSTIYFKLCSIWLFKNEF